MNKKIKKKKNEETEKKSRFIRHRKERLSRQENTSKGMGNLDSVPKYLRIPKNTLGC
jgi:hypothetical protein